MFGTFVGNFCSNKMLFALSACLNWVSHGYASYWVASSDWYSSLSADWCSF